MKFTFTQIPTMQGIRMSDCHSRARTWYPRLSGGSGNSNSACRLAHILLCNSYYFLATSRFHKVLSNLARDHGTSDHFQKPDFYVNCESLRRNLHLKKCNCPGFLASYLMDLTSFQQFCQ
ncbi:hypothetical protein Pan161_27450 [Gimesia algae]|uniref:Uncharacterized protein n=1 Tax=Gimesia algae TaxID=2527971 RepID=A0A517VDK8_9PLAN|nr:hypothetical protein Pan161_27450 [Gimesia algae]